MENIGDKLKARVWEIDWRKALFVLIPMVIASYLGNRVYWLYRHCVGNNMFGRLMVLFSNLALLLKYPLPSIYGDDLMAGVLAAVLFEVVLLYRKSTAKKYRHGVEYGSARWGKPEDIRPFMDTKDPCNNMILTQTERMRIKGRPKHPKYDRNKNVVIVGGSGSGKTRFYAKPQLMQMTEGVSYVFTDPKGYILVGQL